MISLNFLACLSLNIGAQTQFNSKNNSASFSAHQEWNHPSGWKNTLNNIRLVIQPIILFWLIYPWMQIFSTSNLLLSYKHLIEAMNQFYPFYSSA